ncbi:MAG: helix-turn-helix transcriptional regulator [Saprospiraceae bacterium]|nr:helix-turn-helix transcriptional regulator [Saprospiraceae bacterium]
MPSIHEKIRAARVRRGLTQLEAAQLAFISHRTYQRIEAGGTSPTADQLERIAAAFGCSVSDLSAALGENTKRGGKKTHSR